MNDHQDKPGAIAIDKGVPMPRYAGERGAPAKYPFREMEVGDSCFVPGESNQTFRSHAAYAQRSGKKFSARTVVEGGVKGLRVWRIA